MFLTAFQIDPSRSRITLTLFYHSYQNLNYFYSLLFSCTHLRITYPPFRQFHFIDSQSHDSKLYPNELILTQNILRPSIPSQPSKMPPLHYCLAALRAARQCISSGNFQISALHQPDSKSRPVHTISHTKSPLYDCTYSTNFPFRISTQMHFTVPNFQITRQSIVFSTSDHNSI